MYPTCLVMNLDDLAQFRRFPIFPSKFKRDKLIQIKVSLIGVKIVRNEKLQNPM